jgi:hypothetical protein
MLTALAMLAETAPNAIETLPRSGGLFQKGSSVQDMLLVAGVGLALALVLFLIVYLTREKRAREKGLVRSSRVLYKAEGGSSRQSGRGKVRRKRRSHPDNLPRNPTLGETGGLPPLRPEEPSEPVA